MAARKNAPQEETTDVAAVPEALSNSDLTTSTRRQFDDETLRGIQSFEDAMRLAADTFGGSVDISELELGNGFRIATDDDKARLVGQPFLILAYTFNEGDFGEFATMMIITSPNGDKLIVNDGSTGIFPQLLDIMKTYNKLGGIFVSKGLRASVYDTCMDCGKPRKPSLAVCECGNTSERRAKGTTYYLDVA